jgi:hypothetical protein
MSILWGAILVELAYICTPPHSYHCITYFAKIESDGYGASQLRTDCSGACQQREIQLSRDVLAIVKGSR